MLGLTVAVLLQTSLVAADANSYAVAHRRTIETGQPLVVLVGADWCPGCRTMKHATIPEAQQQGLLRNVAFAVVNTDAEPALARQLMKGGSIPQLIMYRKTPTGWKRRDMVGAQSIESIGAFLAVPNGQTEQVTTSTATDAVAGR